MTAILNPDDPQAEVLVRQALAAGRAVGIPTDTVYVLAVDPCAAGASDRLFALLRRPRERDLTLLVANLDQAAGATTALTPAARRLMESFWPGPLTLVLPRNPDSAADLGDDELTVGIRMTGHPAAAGLCRALGPLAAAALGHLQTAGELAEAYEDIVPVVVDGGRCPGPPSTVVDATGEDPHLIREGLVTWGQVSAALR